MKRPGLKAERPREVLGPALVDTEVIHHAMVFALAIKVPIEVAIGIGVVVGIMLLLALGGEAAQRLRERIPKPVVKWAGFALGVLLTGAGVFLLTSFLMETISNSREHFGVKVIDAADGLACALLVAGGAACFYWGRWTRTAAAFAPFVAIALILKPFLWPLQSYGNPSGTSLLPYASRPTVLRDPTGPFSETHLFFLLSGAGLLFLAVLLVWRGVAVRALARRGETNASKALAAWSERKNATK